MENIELDLESVCMPRKKKPTKPTELTRLKRRGNPEAKSLSDPRYRPKVVPDKKKEQNRKLARKPIENTEE